jgi:hypothetical protein
VSKASIASAPIEVISMGMLQHDRKLHVTPQKRALGHTVSVCRWEERAASGKLVSSSDGIVAFDTRTLGESVPRWVVVDSFQIDIPPGRAPADVARSAWSKAGEPDVAAIAVEDPGGVLHAFTPPAAPLISASLPAWSWHRLMLPPAK